MGRQSLRKAVFYSYVFVTNFGKRSISGHQILEYQDLQRDVQKNIRGKIQMLRDKQVEFHAATDDDGKLIQTLQGKRLEVKSEIAAMANDLHLQIDIWQANISCQAEDAFDDILRQTQTKVRLSIVSNHAKLLIYYYE